ncbi:hypothetical protein ACFJGW_00770 [Burkholderiaceae bacterium UC74_6]
MTNIMERISKWNEEDRTRTYEERRQTQSHGEDLMTEGIKAVIVLNSGAIVASLGLMQATVGKEGAPTFLNWAVAGAAAFLVGAIAAVATFFLRRMDLEMRGSQNWWRAAVLCSLLSVVLFAAGVIVLLTGTLKAFGGQPSGEGGITAKTSSTPAAMTLGASAVPGRATPPSARPSGPEAPLQAASRAP